MNPLASISVGVDRTSAATDALRWAVDLAEWSRASVRAVNSWRYPYTMTAPGIAMPDLIVAMPAPPVMQQQGDLTLQEAMDEIDHAIAVETCTTQGDSTDVLVKESKTADLIVVGRPEHHGRWLVGSTTLHSVRHAHCPVAVIPPGSRWPSHPRVAVAIDGSETSIEALAWSMGLISDRGTVVAVHAHDEAMLDDLELDDEFRLHLNEQAATRLDDIVTATAVKGGMNATSVEQVVVAGDARSTVLEAEPVADLFVVGAQGHSGLSGLLIGSFADHAVRHARVPLAVVRR